MSSRSAASVTLFVLGSFLLATWMGLLLGWNVERSNEKDQRQFADWASETCRVVNVTAFPDTSSASSFTPIVGVVLTERSIVEVFAAFVCPCELRFQSFGNASFAVNATRIVGIRVGDSYTCGVDPDQALVSFATVRRIGPNFRQSLLFNFNKELALAQLQQAKTLFWVAWVVGACGVLLLLMGVVFMCNMDRRWRRRFRNRRMAAKLAADDRRERQAAAKAATPAPVLTASPR